MTRKARWYNGQRFGFSEDRRVRGLRLDWALPYNSVSLHKKLCPKLSVFAQVYK